MRKFQARVEINARHVSNSDLTNALRNAIAEHDPGRIVVTDGSMAVRNWSVFPSRGNLLAFSTPKVEARLENLTVMRRTINRLRTQIAGRNACNRECGFYVQVDVSDLGPAQLRNVVRLFWEYENAIFQIHPVSRSQNTQCRGLREFLEAEALATVNPHAETGGALFALTNAVSAAALQGYNVIEFRHASGTLQGEKFVQWVKVCLAMVEIAASTEFEAAPAQRDTVADLARLIGSSRFGAIGIDWLEAQKARLGTWIAERGAELAPAWAPELARRAELAARVGDGVITNTHPLFEDWRREIEGAHSGGSRGFADWLAEVCGDPLGRNHGGPAVPGLERGACRRIAEDALGRLATQFPGIRRQATLDSHARAGRNCTCSIFYANGGAPALARHLDDVEADELRPAFDDGEE